MKSELLEWAKDGDTEHRVFYLAMIRAGAITENMHNEAAIHSALTAIYSTQVKPNLGSSPSVS